MKKSKFIKLLTGRGEIKEQLKFSNIICGILALIVAVILALMAFDIGILGRISGKSEAVYNSMASAYFIISVARIIKNIRIMKNEDMLKRMEIQVKDERNIKIQRRALSFAVFAYVWIGIIAGIIILPFNYWAGITVFYSICTLLILYCIMSFIFHKTM